ncbi:MAG: HAMP domain-containing histidine kinase, partial [Leptospiraceae bacterium]|nr:HAMP domain-containing histidine kinase [Leptospiraceae bacterium]
GAARVEEGLSNTLIILSSVWKGQLEVDKEFAETPEIECDADELNQVWTNLLTNAWQAMKGQSEARIQVSTEYYPDGYSDRESAWQAFVGEVQGPCVCVKICDNGPGIPAEYLEKIWDPFFTTKDQGEGSGLGLSIVRRIVEEHGGAVGVRSARGTEFCVLLPLKQNETNIKKKEGSDRDGAEWKRSERAGGMPRKFQ